jgi:hypothetical protein
VTYSAVAHSAGRTLQGFTDNQASSGPTSGCPGCPYKDFMMYYDYYGDGAYGDTWVTAALTGGATSYASTRGNVDWSAIPSSAGDGPRVEGATKGTNYIVAYMYAIREFEDAYDDCTLGNLGLNDEPVHAWDEGVAFYTGSLEGESGTRARGLSDSGVMFYNLADYRCQNFNTCASGITGISNVNAALSTQWALGQHYLFAGQCTSVRPIVERIVDLMRIPLIQGTMRYAYRIHYLMTTSINYVWYSEMATFAAAILPAVHFCSAADAAIIHAHTAVSTANVPTVIGAQTTDFIAVKEAFERNYACLNITCADVGGFWFDAESRYYDNAAPCGYNAATGTYASPSPPPPATTVVQGSAAAYSVDTSFTASGDPSDYSTSERTALLDATALALGFTSTPPGSTISLTSGSVVVSCTFPVATESAAAAATAAAATFTTPAALTTAINAQLQAAGATITVDSTGTGFTAETGATASSVASTPAESSSSDELPGWGLVVIIVVGVIVVVLCGLMAFMYSKEKAGTPIFTSVAKVSGTSSMSA